MAICGDEINKKIIHPVFADENGLLNHFYSCIFDRSFRETVFSFCALPIVNI